MKKGKIFIICGPSGVGKGTIILGLLKQKLIPLILIPTYTTRNPKPRDKKTGHYRYISKDKFLNLLKNKIFFESNYYSGNYYGTKFSDMKDVIDKNQIGIREQDVEHAFYTKKLFPNSVKIIFIDSPLEIIRQRLTKRGENTPEEIQHRLNLGKKELQKKSSCDFVVENLENDQENTIKKVLEIIKS